MVYHFFQLPPEANLGELDATGARWCGTEWAEVDRARGRETQVRVACCAGICQAHMECQQGKLDTGCKHTW